MNQTIEELFIESEQDTRWVKVEIWQFVSEYGGQIMKRGECHLKAFPYIWVNFPVLSSGPGEMLSCMVAQIQSLSYKLEGPTGTGIWRLTLPSWSQLDCQKLIAEMEERYEEENNLKDSITNELKALRAENTELKKRVAQRDKFEKLNLLRRKIPEFPHFNVK